MIRYHHQPVREPADKLAIRILLELAAHALVAADSDHRRRPVLGERGDEQTKRLLRVSNPSIVPFFVDQRQRAAEELRSIDAAKWY